MATRPAVCVALLLALGWTLCGAAAQAQTANFGGAQTALFSSLNNPSGIAVDASGNVYIADTNHNQVLKETYSAGSYIQSTIGSGLRLPQGVAVDASGNVYIADTGNTRVLKETFSSGSYTQSTVVTGTASNGFIAVAVDASGNVYVADFIGNQVLKETFSAGSYTQSTVGTGLNFPASVAVDAGGNVYIANGENNNVLIVPPSDPACATAGDCTTVGTSLNFPQGVAVDASGNIYIADSGNNRVVKETFSAGNYTQSTVTTGLGNPLALAADSNGNVYIADTTNNRAVEEQIASVNLGSAAVGTPGTAQTLTFNFTNATAANISAPVALTGGVTGKDFAVAAGGTCNATTSYSAGGTSSCTVKVTVNPAFPGVRMGAVELTKTSGAVIATAYVYGTGTAPQAAFPPGVQSSLLIGFTAPAGATTDQAGNIYVADSTAGKVFKYTAAGVLSATVASGLTKPIGVAVDGAGNVFVADNSAGDLFEYALSGSTYTKSTVAGSLSEPQFVAVDVSGNLYVSTSGDHALHVYMPGSGGYTYVKDVANGSTVTNFGPNGVALDAVGNVYVADAGNSEVSIFTPSGSGYTQSEVASSLSSPYGVAVDATGNVYVTLSGGTDVLEFTPGSGGAYTQSTVGSGLGSPAGVAVDAGGNVYVANGSGTLAKTVQKVDVSDPPTLTFASTAIGEASSAQTVTVANIGNASLTIESDPAVAANFVLDSTNTCGVFSSPIAVGASCALALDFKPTEAGSPLTGTATLVDNNLNANTSPFATHVFDLSGIAQSSTSTAVASSVNPSTVNASVSFTATVTNTASGATSAPTGTVQFVVDGANSGSAVSLTVGSGTTSTASIPIASLTISGSPHTITANYLNSDGAFGDSSGSLSAGQTVTAAPATLAFTTVPSGGVTINTEANFRVTLTASPATPIKPAGTMTFSQGSTTLCSNAALSTNAPFIASCTSNALKGPSPATVTASYTDTNRNFIVATPASTAVTLTPLNTTVTLALATTTPTVDTPVTLKALMGPPGNPNFPTGTVSFTSNGVNIPGCSGSSAPSVGLLGSSLEAVCTTSSLAAPSVSIGATYSGDNNFNGSTAGTPLNFSVNKLTPAYTLSAAPQPPNTSITVNVPVVFTIGFTIPGSTAPTQPTGNIAVMQGTTSLCTVVLPAKTCTYSTGFASAASFHVTSSYNGDTQFNTVASGGNTTVTTGATGTTTSVSGPSTASVNTAATFTAIVTSNAVGTAVPQGSVAFKVTNSGGTTTTPCASATLTAGAATCSYAFPASGSYTVNATYNPSPANFTTSSSANAQAVTVDASAVSITVALDSASVNPSVINQPVKFDSTLVFPTGTAKPNGLGDTIVYYDGANVLCTATVNATTSPYTPASCTVYTLSLGGHSVTAAFVPGATDSNFKAQTSTPITQTVNADPTTLLALAPLTPPEVNQTYTLLASVTPAYVYSGSGGRSPSGGSVSFTYVNGSSTVNLCTATVGSESKASCSPAAGSLTAGTYTITATYTDSASPANFVTSNAPTPITVVKDSPAVTIGTLPASIQVNQGLTLTASIKPHFSGPIVPTGTVAFMSGATTLCTATISSGSVSCVAASADLPESAIAYSISATYTPDSTGSTNFLTSSTTTSGSVTVTGATTSVKVLGAPATGYATQTITYTAIVSTSPAIPAGGIAPTGTVTFANTSGLAIGGTNCPKATIPAGTTFPYSVSCTVTYPQTYTGNLNTDSITAAYTPGDANFIASNNSASPLIEPVQNFALGFTSSSSSSVSLTQGHNTTNDPYFTGQIVGAMSTSTASTGIGVLTDTLNYTCTVTSNGSLVTDPSCSPATSAAVPGASVSYTLNASSTAQTGVYTIAITASDPNAPALSYTVTKQLNVASISAAQLVFAGSVPQTVSLNFGTLSTGGSLTLVGCPEIMFTADSSLKQNPDPKNNNAQYVACSASSTPITSGSTAVTVTVTPCQTGATGTAGATTSCGDSTAALVPVNGKAGRSGGSYIAAALGVPVLAFFGWFGRNRARKNLFRMMTIVLLGWGALTVSGCGGGYKVTSTGSSSPATNLAPGTYEVLVQAMDASTPANTYYALVQITVN
ncbi:NHL repeat-containing protein [Terracidiphilus gabretensis]|uniref:NHL repeat-containing protein n=1 Tax=Terracidiphilus gabretensis TaxID=1577687 RepID=UPI0018D20B4E|nr:NHL repeat-containing protein [Terracidiphilus gabretensis]